MLQDVPRGIAVGRGLTEEEPEFFEGFVEGVFCGHFLDCYPRFALFGLKGIGGVWKRSNWGLIGASLPLSLDERLRSEVLRFNQSEML